MKNYSDLMDRYPNLYRDSEADMRTTCMCWGIECGIGWYDLIDEVSSKLEAIILELPEESRETVRAVQVKEKFGGLRFYMTCYNDSIDKAIEEAEAKAAITCELCGSPGGIRNDSYWYSTRCDKCYGEKGDT